MTQNETPDKIVLGSILRIRGIQGYWRVVGITPAHGSLGGFVYDCHMVINGDGNKLKTMTPAIRKAYDHSSTLITKDVLLQELEQHKLKSYRIIQDLFDVGHNCDYIV